jgi:hypothetical protein
VKSVIFSPVNLRVGDDRTKVTEIIAVVIVVAVAAAAVVCCYYYYWYL